MKSRIFSLLRKSESLFKTDMVYVAKGGFWLSVGQGVASLLSFGLAIAFANLLPQHEYGVYKYILSIIGMLGALSLTGMGTAVAQSVARGFEKALHIGYKESLYWSIPGTLLGLLATLYYFLKGNEILSVGILIGTLATPLINSAGLYSFFLQGKKEFKLSALYRIVRDITPILFVFLGLLYTDNPLILIGLWFSGTAGALFFIYIRVSKSIQEGDTPPNLTPFALHLSVMNALVTTTNYIDKILIFHYLGAVQLAIYTFAIAIPDQLKTIARTLSSLALPKFSESTHVPPLGYRTLLLVGALGGITFVYISIAPFIYSLLFPLYVDAIPFSQVYALAIVTFVGLVHSTLLKAKERTEDLYWYNITSSILQIVGIAVGVLFWGIWGVIWARIITRYLNLLQLIIMTKKIGA